MRMTCKVLLKIKGYEVYEMDDDEALSKILTDQRSRAKDMKRALDLYVKHREEEDHIKKTLEFSHIRHKTLE